MKTCRVCGEEKPSEQFRAGRRCCKECTADYRRQYRLVNLERETERDRTWYATNRVAKVAYARQYQEANRKDVLERRRSWYAENRKSEVKRNRRRYWAEPEVRRELARRWSRENPEKNAARQHRRRSRRPAKLGQDDYAYMGVLRADPCAYCGGAANTIDHIEPLDSGGDGRWENLTASCRSCNSSKSTAALLAFLRRAKNS